MEVKLLLKDFNNKELLKIKKYTNLPMSIIKSEDSKPFFSFMDFEDFEKNNYDINITNDFNSFKNLIIFLSNENISYIIENYNNLEELESDYNLNNKINKEAIHKYKYESNRIAYEIDILDFGIPNTKDEDL